jgi:hypothetical protein
MTPLVASGLLRAVPLFLLCLVLAGCSLLDSGDVSPTTAPVATATPASLPTFAPDGRTGIADLDTLIESVVKADAEEMAQAFAGIEATVFGNNDIIAELTAGEWTPRLAGLTRRLYAVYRDGQREIPLRNDYFPPARDFTILVNAGPTAVDVSEHWSFAVRDGAVVGVLVAEAELFPSVPPGPGRDRAVIAPSQPPRVAEDYTRYLVLPPQSDLPVPPPGHELSVRTGDPAVDEMLTVLEAGDAGALLAALLLHKQPCGPGHARTCPANGSDTVEALPVWGPDRGLAGPFLKFKSRAESEELVSLIATQVFSIDAVADVPEGYEPAPGFVAEADHLIVLTRQLGPYWWEPVGLFERDGLIVGIVEGNGRGVHYPSAFIVPPAAGDWSYQPPADAYLVPPPQSPAELQSALLSDIATLDAFLEAANRLDTRALEEMTDFVTQQPCMVPSGNSIQVGLVYCRPGEDAGTLVDVLPATQCSDVAYLRREGAFEELGIHSHGPLPRSVYAVIEDEDFIAVIVPTVEESGFSLLDSLALRFQDGRVVEAFRACANRTYVPPYEDGLPWPQRAPAFLLEPLD